MPSVGSQIWRHLPTNQRRIVPEQPRSLAAAMYPSLTPQAKAQDELLKQRRKNLLQFVRDLNAGLRPR